MSCHFVSCCVPHTLLVCSDNQQDADRSTASHPEVRRTSRLKKEPLTTYSEKAGEGDSVGCDHTYSLLCHVHTGLNDTVLTCPCGTLRKEESVHLPPVWIHKLLLFMCQRFVSSPAFSAVFSVCCAQKSTKTIARTKPRKAVRLKFICRSVDTALK